MKVTGIKKNEHGLLDLAYVPTVFMAPKLAGFEENKTAAAFCKAFSIGALGYSLLTDAKWGVFKVIPYKVHAALDFSSGVMALTVAFAVPQIANDKAARKTFIAMGITGLIVGTLSMVGAKQSLTAWYS